MDSFIIEGDPSLDITRADLVPTRIRACVLETLRQEYVRQKRTKDVLNQDHRKEAVSQQQIQDIASQAQSKAIANQAEQIATTGQKYVRITAVQRLKSEQDPLTVKLHVAVLRAKFVTRGHLLNQIEGGAWPFGEKLV
ncbi:hypothetical protein OEA41_007971 [Lepraria neglecta]|uniref:Uncharacterized protein n=1 Tax=Lepraria neglecta TaxID=209136 RepID=A0AAD9ZEW7_9LECA|nr:hypothetical protein OEA41_007971 [Lepraria neglecta]